ncbi:hypothetical protein JCM8547_006949 [Rhodosporidiobolus lusitaniae]
MASFSSLPRELVEEICRLSLPAFFYETWDKRVETLKALLIVNKRIGATARRLLLEYLVLKTPRAVEAFLAVHSHGQTGVRELYLGSSPPTSDDGLYLDPSGAVTANEMDLEVLLRLLRPTTLALRNVYHIQPADVAQCSSLQALYINVGSIVHTSAHAMQGVAFSDLKRLSLSQVNIPRPSIFFQRQNFPALEAFSIAYCDQLCESAILDGATANGASLALTRLTLPLITHLDVLSTPSITRDFEIISLRILDTRFSVEVLDMLHCLPPTLRILRLDGPVGSAADLLAQLHTNLFSPRFRPKLTELHFVGWPLAAHETLLNSILVSDWAKRAEVKVFVVMEELQDCDEGDPSFWQFLDDAERRLKELD